MFEREDEGRLLYRADTQTAIDRLPRNDDTANTVRISNKLNKFMDSSEGLRLHATLLGHYFRELDRQGTQRELMARDEAFRDHLQFTAEELQELEERGQVPLVYNLILPTVNWVTGTERRTIKDFRILPRRKEGLRQAELKTELMKYLTDVNHSQHHYSRAFNDQVSVGLGWIEAGHRADFIGGEPVYDRYENWRNMLWDSTSVEYDLEDARYIWRTKWTDVDMPMSLFPERAEAIRQAQSIVYEAGTSLDGAGDEVMDNIEEEHFRGHGMSWARYGSWGMRDRVRMMECWFKRVVKDNFMSGGDFDGEVFDPWSPGHVHNLNRGFADIVTRPRMRTMVAIMTIKGLLYVGTSPYRHDRYPFTPLWGYRRAEDNMPYGLIRGIIDPQRDFNRRASKSLHILSTAQVLMEEGSVTDEEELRTEVARPDGILKYKTGRQPPQKLTDTNLAAAHQQLMQMDMQLIQLTSGVTDENLGRDTNAQSGRAIIAKQDQGQLTTSVFFDNAAFARRLHGEKLLSLIEQFYTKQKEFRITTQRGNPDYRAINTPDPEQDDVISMTKADFIISEEDWRATVRAAQAEMLIDLMSKLASTAPELVVASMDLLIEALDVPKRDELVKRVRQVTGQTDPDADPENPDEDTKAIMAQREAQAQMQARAQEAEISGMEAETQEKLAKAKKTIMEAAKTEQGLTGDQISYLQSAVQAAIELISAQDVATVADKLVAEAAWRAREGLDGQLGLGAMPQQQPPAPQGAPEPVM